jgi:hypothetical protein
VLRSYRDKKVVGVFVRFRAPLQQEHRRARIAPTRALATCAGEPAPAHPERTGCPA